MCEFSGELLCKMFLVCSGGEGTIGEFLCSAWRKKHKQQNTESICITCQIFLPIQPGQSVLITRTVFFFTCILFFL